MAKKKAIMVEDVRVALLDKLWPVYDGAGHEADVDEVKWVAECPL